MSSLLINTLKNVLTKIDVATEHFLSPVYTDGEWFFFWLGKFGSDTERCGLQPPKTDPCLLVCSLQQRDRGRKLVDRWRTGGGRESEATCGALAPHAPSFLRRARSHDEYVRLSAGPQHEPQGRVER